LFKFIVLDDRFGVHEIDLTVGSESQSLCKLASTVSNYAKQPGDSFVEIIVNLNGRRLFVE